VSSHLAGLGWTVRNDDGVADDLPTAVGEIASADLALDTEAVSQSRTQLLNELCHRMCGVMDK
jgi:hypothetical protein